MKYKITFALTLTVVFFLSCVTYDSNSTETNSQNTTSRTNVSNKPKNTIAYILENGEKLSTFIVTQNDLNEYAKHENEPTASFYKEKFTEFENHTKEAIKERPEEAISEFQQEFPDISFNEFIDLFRKIGFFYKIEYNINLKVWHLELIGRSTTLKLDFANTRREGMSYYHRVVPHINRWMELNNVGDLNFILRVYINDIDDDAIPELFGEPLG